MLKFKQEDFWIGVVNNEGGVAGQSTTKDSLELV